MKRLVTFVLLLVFLALTALSALAWINNLFVVRAWYVDLVRGNVDHGGQLLSKVHHGPFASLDWTAVDLSTITTFIPFFGFLLATLALLRLLLGQRRFPEDYPYFRCYDRVNVSLGLVGTLWGIIIIGYYPVESVSMSALMMCLHTALFSTLVAVVWVFIMVMLIIKPLFGWWAGVVVGDTDQAQGEDLVSVLERLRAAAAGTRDALADNHAKLTGFNLALDEAESKTRTMSETVERFREGLGKELFNFLELSFSKFDSSLASLRQESGALRAAEAARDALLDKTAAALDKTLAAQEALAARLGDLDRKHDALRAEAAALATEHAAAKERLAAASAAQQTAESQLAKIKEALR